MGTCHRATSISVQPGLRRVERRQRGLPAHAPSPILTQPQPPGRLAPSPPHHLSTSPPHHSSPSPKLRRERFRVQFLAGGESGQIIPALQSSLGKNLGLHEFADTRVASVNGTAGIL